MRKFLSLLFASPLLIVMALIAIVNVNVYYQPVVAIDKSDTINLEVINELRGLRHGLANGADYKMQEIYPEGYVFLNAIYALAWCNILENIGHDSPLYSEGVGELEKCFAKIDSDEGRSQFEEDLPLSYGAFYTGWSNYLLGRKLSIEPVEKRDSIQVRLFKDNCERIARALEASNFPVSYYAQAWPADVTVSLASLTLHDKLFADRYNETTEGWIRKIKSMVDSHGLIPHAVNPSTGRATEPARGSSQGLILILLHDIDRTLAEKHFAIYKSLFFDSTFGLTGIREYPKGLFGIDDVDSGPIIFGYGGAATIVGMQTFAVFGDVESALKIRNTIEGLAMPFTYKGAKKYFFGLVPMADAFIAWGHNSVTGSEVGNPSFLRFHLYSFGIFLLLAIFFWVLIRPRTPDSREMMHTTW